MIFWTVSISITGAIMYDAREKRRATAKWARTVSHLRNEPMPDVRAMPRRLTVYIESPPTDAFRPARVHFDEYAKPILQASGLDWEIVQGRREGDVRGAVAERIRRERRDLGETVDGMGLQEEDMTTAEKLNDFREKIGVVMYEGIKGDLILGRHAWKEYIRGLHEGWLGPLTSPFPAPEPEPEPKKEGEETKKPTRPPAPPPYISPTDYDSLVISPATPSTFQPSGVLELPHLLGFSGTLIRMRRFFNRRELADSIGREVAAACLAHDREFTAKSGGDHQHEQQVMLLHEEQDWPKSVWEKAEKKLEHAPPETTEADENTTPVEKTEAEKASEKEIIWAAKMHIDPRISERMRKFTIRPEDEERAKAIVVPEEDIEGWIRRNLRYLYRWGSASLKTKPAPIVGNLDE